MGEIRFDKYSEECPVRELERHKVKGDCSARIVSLRRVQEKQVALLTGPSFPNPWYSALAVQVPAAAPLLTHKIEDHTLGSHDLFFLPLKLNLLAQVGQMNTCLCVWVENIVPIQLLSTDTKAMQLFCGVL